MSVIVRMQMPKRCYDCDFADGVYCMAIGGCVMGKEIPKMTWIKTRPSWCPIIGVLPDEHGDLIDKRELLKKGMDMSWSVQKWVQEVDIVTAPTIVPATERAKHDIS